MTTKTHKVTDENLRKVIRFFIDQMEKTGDNHIEATVVEIANGSGVALATAHRAIKRLGEKGQLKIIKPVHESRRYGITYVVTDELYAQFNEHSQLEYLQKLVEKYQMEVADLKNEISMLQQREQLLLRG